MKPAELGPCNAVEMPLAGMHGAHRPVLSRIAKRARAVLATDDDEQSDRQGVRRRTFEFGFRCGIPMWISETGAQYSPVPADGWRGVLAVSALAKLHGQFDRNDISVHGDIGAGRLFDRGSASSGIRLGRRWLGGDRYSDGIGPWARDRL